MSLIEGVGDEVTAFFVIVLLILVLCLAWISTSIRDIPFFSVIIVELAQGRRRIFHPHQPSTEGISENLAGTEQSEIEQDVSSTDTSTGDSSESQEQETQSERLSESPLDGVTFSETSAEISQDSVDAVTPQNETNSLNQENILPNTDDNPRNLTETELRQRRLDFFQKPIVSSRRSEVVEGSVIVDHSNQSNQNNETGSVSSPSAENKDVRTNGSDQSESFVNNSDSPNSSRSESLKSSPNAGEDNSSSPRQESAESQISIRLKYLNDTQRNVVASPNDTVGQFRRANFATELSENKLVRFIFNGQDLRNDTNTLQAYNIVDNSVIHCLITQASQNTTNPRMHQDEGFDIGNLMLPLFGFIICIVWYLRFEYRQFFTATSTVSLIGVTFLFIAAVLATWEGHRRGHAHQHIE